MPSIFKTKNLKVSKLSSLIHSTSDIFYGVGVLRGRIGKLRQTPGGLTTSTGQFDSTIMSISSTTTTSIGSNSFSSNSPLCHRPPIGNGDLALQPNLVTGFVSQTSPNLNERPPNPTSTNSGTEMHCRGISPDVPSSPLPQDSASAIFVSEVQANPLMDITYDAILVSTLHQNLGMIMMEGTKYLDIPATRTPPDSPAAIQEGGFGSLMGVSMAIMKGTT